MFPLVISFYTENTFYAWEVEGLISSCLKWGLEHHVEGVPCRGSWELNCAFKPFFIYEMLKKFRRPLFWVDADAAFIQKPEPLSVFSSDIAVRFNEDLGKTSDSYVLSGSLFVNYSQGGEKVVRLWAEKCAKALSDPTRTEEFWDQIALKEILEEEKNTIKVGALPASYAKIQGRAADEELQAVIEHYQASRRYKKLIQG